MKLLNASSESTSAEKTIQLADLKSIISEKNINSQSSSNGNNNNNSNNLDLVESACKLLIEQVLKQCPNANLASITIKTSSVPSEQSTSSSSNNPSTATSTQQPMLTSSTTAAPTTEAKTTFTTIQLSDLKNSGRNLSDELKNSNLNLSTLVASNTSISGSVASTPAATAYPLSTLMNSQLMSIKTKLSPTTELPPQPLVKKARLEVDNRTSGTGGSPAAQQQDEFGGSKRTPTPAYSAYSGSGGGSGFKTGSTLATGRRSKDSEVRGFIFFNHLLSIN
jgi:hypothetical protein